MSAAAAMDLARASGVDLSLEGEGIRYKAPVTAPAGVLDQLRARKAEVIELLRAERGDLPPARVMTLAEMAGYRLSLARDGVPKVTAPAKRSLIIESVLQRCRAQVCGWLQYERRAVIWWRSRPRR
jgi:hypothetical protein